MIPGMGRMNPRQMKQAMKRMGISTEEMDGVEEVIIRTADTEHVIKSPSVSITSVQGQKTYQVVGETVVRPRQQGAAVEEEDIIPAEDVELVMSQTGCDADTARKALKECSGQPAEAILKIMTA